MQRHESPTRGEDERPVRKVARLHVCSLAAMPDIVRGTGARHLITVINGQMIPPTPAGIADGDHLRIACNDIAEPRDGLICPDDTHVGELIRFATRWAHEGPLVIHCWAGISRSTAAAFVTLADDALRRAGRMVDAIDRIGPGAPLMSAPPFALDSRLDGPQP